jgi:hypothetical protein
VARSLNNTSTSIDAREQSDLDAMVEAESAEMTRIVRCLEEEHPDSSALDNAGAETLFNEESDDDFYPTADEDEDGDEDAQKDTISGLISRLQSGEAGAQSAGLMQREARVLQGFMKQLSSCSTDAEVAVLKSVIRRLKQPELTIPDEVVRREVTILSDMFQRLKVPARSNNTGSPSKVEIDDEVRAKRRERNRRRRQNKKKNMAQKKRLSGEEDAAEDGAGGAYEGMDEDLDAMEEALDKGEENEKPVPAPEKAKKKRSKKRKSSDSAISAAASDVASLPAASPPPAVGTPGAAKTATPRTPASGNSKNKTKGSSAKKKGPSASNQTPPANSADLKTVDSGNKRGNDGRTRLVLR